MSNPAGHSLSFTRGGCTLARRGCIGRGGGRRQFAVFGRHCADALTAVHFVDPRIILHLLTPGEPESTPSTLPVYARSFALLSGRRTACLLIGTWGGKGAIVPFKASNTIEPAGANGDPRMEKPESSMGEASVVDLEDRDPNNLNQHLQVMWDDVIGEPEGIRSPECAWRLSGHCFRLSRGCCYIFLSVLVAPLFALCLGFTFACLSFEHIWCVAPCLRIWKITCAATRNFFTAFVQAIVRPVMEAIGSICNNVRVYSQKLPDGPAPKDDMLVV